MFLIHGNVMEMLTAKMQVMKTQPFATIESVIQKLSSLVRMDDVFRSYGNVILTMTVEMILMNRLTSAGSANVLMVGRDAQVKPTIDAFPSGCSVMERMIVGMAVMNFHKTVPSAMRRETSNVPTTIVASRRDGCVTLKMIAETIVMKVRHFAVDLTENALNLNSDATTTNVFQVDGVVTMMMTVGMVVMNSIAQDLLARMEHSSALVGIVLLLTSAVMVTVTAVTCQMKWDAHLVTPMEGTVLNPDSNVTTTCVSHKQISVMELMTVETTPMNLLNSVPTSTVIL